MESALSTRFRGYALTGIVQSPDLLMLHLREPRGKTPVRFRLVGPWTLEGLSAAPAKGLPIDSTEWNPDPEGRERLVVHFANGQSLVATCKQVILDVY